ncbi:MAG: hypothetical protein H0W72_02995 [Planctomycetes bacterium]|nr:hypothetical protein [Planctomycetota bacterium]
MPGNTRPNRLPRRLAHLAVAMLPALALAAEPVAPVVDSAPDPSVAVVAEGAYLYRQRDLDALVMIAVRHSRQKPTRDDEQQLRVAITQALTAREPLVAALARLPASLHGKARDALLLDLLDYQADPMPARPLAPQTAPEQGEKTAPAPIANLPAEPAKPASATPPATPAATPGPVMVRLPPLTLVRSIEGVGRRQLTLGLALYFANAEQSKRFEDQAPLIQDAILGQVHQLPAKEFAEPNQLALKEALIKAIQGRVANFPADGLLIPQLEAGAAEDAEGKSK